MPNNNILDAAEAHIKRYSAVIAKVDVSGEQGIGTATCIEVDNRFFLSSAAHNFEVVEGGGEVKIFSCHKSPHAPIESIAHNYSQFSHEGSLDLAWLEIDPDAARRCSLEGLALSSIDPNPSFDRSASYTIAGFPIENAKFYQENKQPRLTCQMTLYCTIPAKPNPDDGGLFFDYPEDAISIDGPPVPNPGGMSGGGAWCLPFVDKSPIWAPRFQVVGITTHFFPITRRIRSIRFLYWLRFLLADHPELSGHLEHLLR